MKSKYRNIFLIFGIVAIVVMLCTFDMEYDELLANLRRAGIWLPAVIGLWVIIYLFNTLSSVSYTHLTLPTILRV